MAQGKMKVKSKVPAGTKKRLNAKKSNNAILKKGIQIKPKKAQKVEAQKLKKKLEKTINANIETQLRAKAVSQDGLQFRVASKQNVTKNSGVLNKVKKK